MNWLLLTSEFDFKKGLRGWARVRTIFSPDFNPQITRILVLVTQLGCHPITSSCSVRVKTLIMLPDHVMFAKHYTL